MTTDRGEDAAMADERTYPCLPCPALDDSIAFYESLGFRRTYRQIRPIRTPSSPARTYPITSFPVIQIPDR